MRIFTVPAAIFLACCVYMPLPAAADWPQRLLVRGYARFQRSFSGSAKDDVHALLIYLLALCGVLTLLCAVHPLISMALMAPAFTGVHALPGCAQAKADLDSGKYARDIPAYESLVRSTCMSLAPAFAHGVIVPMLLGAAGMPLHMGAPLCMAYLAVWAIDHPACVRITAALHRTGERLLVAFMLLCAGAVGRNPLRTKGNTPEARLLSTLNIAQGEAHARAPMAGDIPQGIFLCGLASLVLCFVLCAVGFVLCR